MDLLTLAIVIIFIVISYRYYRLKENFSTDNNNNNKASNNNTATNKSNNNNNNNDNKPPPAATHDIKYMMESVQPMKSELIEKREIVYRMPDTVAQDIVMERGKKIVFGDRSSAQNIDPVHNIQMDSDKNLKLDSTEGGVQITRNGTPIHSFLDKDVVLRGGLDKYGKFIVDGKGDIYSKGMLALGNNAYDDPAHLLLHSGDVIHKGYVKAGTNIEASGDITADGKIGGVTFNNGHVYTDNNKLVNSQNINVRGRLYFSKAAKTDTELDPEKNPNRHSAIHDTDPMFIEKTTIGTDKNTLRIVIGDNTSDSIEIWGNGCGVKQSAYPGKYNCRTPGGPLVKIDGNGNLYVKGNIYYNGGIYKDKMSRFGWSTWWNM